MSANALKTHILPALVAGSRGALPLERAGVATPLQALALTAQALRFERPAAPSAFQVEEAIVDSRAVVPETVRQPLIRLLTAKLGGVAPEAMPDAVARVMAARRLRLHPFDLARLDGFVKSHAEYLGAEAMAFADRQAAPEQKRGYFEADTLDDATWTQGTPTQRQAYVARHRRTDAAAGRALVEGVWGNEPADVRVRLLAALSEGLGPDDAAFLGGLAKDRAPRVRELAARLLARLPGHQGDNPALRSLVERIKVKQVGFLTKRTAVSLELPATVKPQAASAWIGEAFGGAGLDEMAHALGLKTADLVGAAEKDDHLLLGLAVMATRDKRFDVLAAVTDRLADTWQGLNRAGIADLDGFSADERAQWAQIVVRPQTWAVELPVWDVIKLLAQLDGPAPEALMRRLLESRSWKAHLKDEDKIHQGILEVMAALCPPAVRPALRAQLASLVPVQTSRVFLFLDILDALEAPNA